MDFITNTLYITTIVLKAISYMIVQTEMNTGKETYKLNREKWDPWDPTLIRLVRSKKVLSKMVNCFKLI